MASNANWTIVFDDKIVLKNYDEGAALGGAVGYKIEDDDFWNQSKFSNIWAIQYGTSNSSDEVEYRDTTPHSSYIDANLGDFKSQFIDKWDSVHLNTIQSDWDNNVLLDDNNNVVSETEEEKITRLGPRPTSYSSS